MGCVGVGDEKRREEKRGETESAGARRRAHTRTTRRAAVRSVAQRSALPRRVWGPRWPHPSVPRHRSIRDAPRISGVRPPRRSIVQQKGWSSGNAFFSQGGGVKGCPPLPQQSNDPCRAISRRSPRYRRRITHLGRDQGHPQTTRLRHVSKQEGASCAPIHSRSLRSSLPPSERAVEIFYLRMYSSKRPGELRAAHSAGTGVLPDVLTFLMFSASLLLSLWVVVDVVGLDETS